MNVLISGASIAGLTMAHWMHRYGYKVTVVEIGPAPRMGGSPIDVRGDALDLAAEMGILPQIQAARLATEGLEFVNASNEVEGKMLVEQIGNLRPGEDVELRRDDLVNILYEHQHEDIEYLFNDRIKEIIQQENYVEVVFNNGKQANYDFVIGADGVHSGVRKLVFGPEEQFTHFLDYYFAIVEVDKDLGKNNHGQMYNVPGKMATIYSYNKKMADAILVFKSPKFSYDFRDVDMQKKILLNAFAAGSWKIPQILEALNKADRFYFDQVCQIKMPSWTKGRVALVGDAGYCAAFPTGMGSTLAMLGAANLAKQLANNSDHQLAFKNYNESFRPTVATLQARVYDGISFLLPETEEAIYQRNTQFN